MFPILLGKIKELEDKINNIEPPRPVPTKNFRFDITCDNNGVLNKTFKEIENKFNDNYLCYIKHDLNGDIYYEIVMGCGYDFTETEKFFIAGRYYYFANTENDYPVTDY